MTGRRRSWLQTAPLYLIAILASVLFMVPFVFALGTSLKPISLVHVLPPLLVPPLDQAQPSNYVRLFNLENIPFAG